MSSRVPFRQSASFPFFKSPSSALGWVYGAVRWWSNLLNLEINFVKGQAMASGSERALSDLISETRASSAMVLEDNGAYVERYGSRTNVIPSDMAGSAVGVLGSGGSLPDGWSNTYVGTEVLAFDDSPAASIDLRFSGTLPEFPAFFVQPIGEASGLVTQVGDVAIVSAYVTRLPGPWNPVFNFNLNLQRRTIGNVFISQKASVTLSDLALGERRLVEVSFAITDPTAVRVFGFFTSSGNGGVNRDFSVRIEKPQLELKSFRTPFIYGPAFAVSEPELAIGHGVGLQVSAQVDNLFLNPTLQGHTSWIAGGDGDCDLTANAGLDPTGAQVATVVENQSAFNFGSQFYQGVAIVDTEMTISMWAYADEAVAATLKLNDNENNHNVTIGTTMQRFDHTGTIGPALLGGGLGRCGFQSGEDWQGKGVVIAWVQINVGGPAPFAVGTRAADNPVVTQGLSDELLAEGDTPHNWTDNNVTSVDNPDGTTTVISGGATWQRLVTEETDDWIAGVTYRNTASYKEGTSGTAAVVLKYEGVGTVYGLLGGAVGALAVVTETGCALSIISQTLVGDTYHITYDFTPALPVPVAQVGIGPYSATSGETVVAVSSSNRKRLPYTNYSPDSQAYAETLTQIMSNPVYAGTLGARPDGYSNVGPIHVVKVLAPETVGGVACNPVAIRRLNSSGYEGVKSLPETPLSVGEHLVTYYIRAVPGVTVANSFSLIAGSGTPGLIVLEDKPTLEGLTPGVWYKRVKTVTLTSASNYAGMVATSGAIGTGYDIALFNVVLNTTQDVETQTERGVFSRILAGDGFTSEAFPSAGDLLPSVDLSDWGISNADNVTFVEGGVQLDVDPDNDEPYIHKTFTNFRVGGVYRMGIRREVNTTAGNFIRASLSVVSPGVYFIGASASAGSEPRDESGHFIASATSREIFVKMSGTRLSNSMLELRNFSLQEVEPGVVIEAVGVWGSAIGQHVLRLDDKNNGGTFMLVQRTSTGKIKLKIKSDGTTLFDQDTTSNWPDDAAGTFRLELTDTGGGCFAALFLDDVFVIGSDAFDYHHAINQLVLAPVAGVKIVTKITCK